MREIKFRAWHNEGKEWVDDIVIDTRGNYYISDRCEFEGDNRRLVLCQYTGLKDKNGREIYEGDIVSQNYATHDHDGTAILDGPGKSLWAIYWGEDIRHGAWRGLGIGVRYVAIHIPTESMFDTESVFAMHRFREIEVVGNIYENPELLDKKT